MFQVLSTQSQLQPLPRRLPKYVRPVQRGHSAQCGTQKLISKLYSSSILMSPFWKQVTSGGLVEGLVESGHALGGGLAGLQLARG